MGDLPTPNVVTAAAKRLAGDFAHMPGITRITPSMIRGAPVVAVLAIVPRPSSFPRAVNVTLPGGGAHVLPIIWQQVVPSHGVAKGYFGTRTGGNTAKKLPPVMADKPIDAAMWGGASIVTDRPGTLLSPGHTPDIGVVEDIPTTEEQRYQLSVGARWPQFVTPNFWSIPFDRSGDVCTEFYETWYNAYAFTVPSDRMVIVTGISYQFNDTVIPFDHFDVEVFRSGQSLGSFEDMRALNTADPAEEYVLAGHYRPLPYYGRFDHDEQIVAKVRVRGAFPFVHTPFDPLGGCFQIFLTGWMASLYDNRDGGARPVDMGDLNLLALGDKQW